MSYLQGFFEMKYKKKMLDAFRAGFEHMPSGKISEQQWIRGLQKLGVDSISNEEARMVFRYLDYQGSGEIGYEEFKDIMHEERPPKAQN